MSSWVFPTPLCGSSPTWLLTQTTVTNSVQLTSKCLGQCQALAWHWKQKQINVSVLGPQCQKTQALEICRMKVVLLTQVWDEVFLKWMPVAQINPTTTTIFTIQRTEILPWFLFLESLLKWNNSLTHNWRYFKLLTEAVRAQPIAPGSGLEFSDRDFPYKLLPVGIF